MVPLVCCIDLTTLVNCLLMKFGEMLQVSLVSKDSPMLDGLDTASIEMEEAKVLF